MCYAPERCGGEDNRMWGTSQMGRAVGGSAIARAYSFSPRPRVLLVSAKKMGSCFCGVFTGILLRVLGVSVFASSVC